MDHLELSLWEVDLLGTIDLGGAMKKFTCLSLLVFLFMTMPAWADTLTLNEVGSIDSLIAKTWLQNSGEATETAWVNTIETDLSYAYKNGDFDWHQINDNDDTTDLWAQSLETDADFYIIKTGNLHTGFRDFLFENLFDLGYAVIDLKDFGAPNIGKVSHITEFTKGDVPSPVPEPATMVLFGTGLLGLAGISRKQFKK